MRSIPTLSLIRLGQARDLTCGSQASGVPEIDFTLIRPMG